jgi:hypothetical protein
MSSAGSSHSNHGLCHLHALRHCHLHTLLNLTVACELPCLHRSASRAALSSMACNCTSCSAAARLPSPAPDGAVVRHLQRLQVLHQAALQVAGAGGLHRSVHQPLPASHAVEVVLLGPQPSQEAVPDEAAGPVGSGVCRWVWGGRGHVRCCSACQVMVGHGTYWLGYPSRACCCG